MYFKVKKYKKKNQITSYMGLSLFIFYFFYFLFLFYIHEIES
jgi:hypothetical protein